MALHGFQTERRSPAFASDKLISLLDELKAFRDSVVVPAKKCIDENPRNVNLLAQEAEEEEEKKPKDKKH